jgi:15-cis-phytoene synthase
MTPDEYCREKVAKSGSSFYYSFLFLPPERRSAITALYAFCREVDDVVDEQHEPTVARAKLAWWRQEVAHVYSGDAQHPVARALQTVVARYPLPQAHFQTVIDGMAMDLDQNRYLDFAALEQYCHRVAGVVGLMSAEIFGYEHADTRQYARDLGIAFQLTNILRDVGEDARRGRI